MVRSHFIVAAFLLSASCSESRVAAQPEVITERDGVPALFEEVSAATAEVVVRNQPALNLDHPIYSRSRVLRVRTELLPREADIDDLSPLYLNLFSDLGFRVYIHGRIEREYGVDWLASPFAESNGRAFVNLIDTLGAHAYSGMRVEMNIPDPRFDGIRIAPIGGTDYVAITQSARGASSDDPNRPDLIVYQSSSVVLSEPGQSFLAEAGVRIDYSGLDTDFADEKVGYFLTTGGLYHRDPSQLYGTTDGGRTWAVINDALPGTPSRIYFSDRKAGYLTLSQQRGCQTTDDCRDAPSLVMKTRDGGVTWGPLDDGLVAGVPYIFGLRGDDSLYGIFSGLTQGDRRVLRVSHDGGAAWRDSYEFPAGEIVNRAELVEGYIFVNFWSGELYKIEVATGVGRAIEIVGTKVRDFRVPSADTIFAEIDGSAGSQLLMTTDSGERWTQIPLDSWFKLIAAPSDKELVLVVNKGSYGPSDSAATTDVISYSRDAGATWETTLSIGGLITGTRKALSVSNNLHKVLLNDRVLTIHTTR